MNTLRLLFIFFVILMATIYMQAMFESKSKRSTLNNDHGEVLATIAPPNHTITPKITSSPPPTINANDEDRSNDQLIYPGSTVVKNTAKEIDLQSSNDPEDITDWYKNLLSKMGFSAKSFVQTNANANILNKLSGSDSKEQVLVEIERKSNEAMTSMKILLSTP